jgi:hypothetical protein
VNILVYTEPLLQLGVLQRVFLPEEPPIAGSQLGALLQSALITFRCFPLFVPSLSMSLVSLLLVGVWVS